MPEELKDKVRTAVKRFVEDDIKLLDLRVYEPAVSHRIAVYLEELFQSENESLNVDCEYDKSLDLRKRLPDNRAIRPDILVHIRNERENNILVMEIKRRHKSAWDEKKLEELTRQNGTFKYKLGVFVYFPEGQPRFKWFMNGQGVWELV